MLAADTGTDCATVLCSSRGSSEGEGRDGVVELQAANLGNICDPESKKFCVVLLSPSDSISEDHKETMGKVAAKYQNDQKFKFAWVSTATHPSWSSTFSEGDGANLVCISWPLSVR